MYFSPKKKKNIGIANFDSKDRYIVYAQIGL
jgi:hypothetical protein